MKDGGLKVQTYLDRERWTTRNFALIVLWWKEWWFQGRSWFELQRPFEHQGRSISVRRGWMGWQEFGWLLGKEWWCPWWAHPNRLETKKKSRPRRSQQGSKRGEYPKMWDRNLAKRIMIIPTLADLFGSNSNCIVTIDDWKGRRVGFVTQSLRKGKQRVRGESEDTEQSSPSINRQTTFASVLERVTFVKTPKFGTNLKRRLTVLSQAIVFLVMMNTLSSSIFWIVWRHLECLRWPFGVGSRFSTIPTLEKWREIGLFGQTLNHEWFTNASLQKFEEFSPLVVSRIMHHLPISLLHQLAFLRMSGVLDSLLLSRRILFVFLDTSKVNKARSTG